MNNRKKGFAQTDYVVAIGLFILIFALVVQYVSNYFSTVGDTTSQRVMSSQATSLLDIMERGYEPSHWPNTAPNASTVLLLHLDNSTKDSSQYGNNGTISGANCSAAVSGKLDKGCSFDGINDYIDVSSSGSLSIIKEVTVAAWIYPPTGFTSDYRAIVYAGDDGNSYNLLTNTGDGNLRAWFGGNALNSNTSLLAGNWSHVAATFDNSTIKLYINGLLDNSSSASGSIVTGKPVTIGSSNAHTTYFFNGTIDEVAIWNRSLSADEIYNLWAYENLLDRIGLTTKAYRFDVLVNNSAPYWKTGDPVETIGNELVRINFTEIGFGANIPSLSIYESNGSSVGYNINGNTVTFRTAISANSAKRFTVYFDDDSSFIEQTSALAGVDNLSEVIEPVQPLPMIQNRKMSALSNANYTRVKNSTGLPRDFGMRMNDVDASFSVLSFGPPVPPSGNIISYRRYALYQNATGAVRKARITIQVW